MDCLEIADRLLVPGDEHESEVEAHLADCSACAQLARGIRRLDAVLMSTVVIEPPLELQHALAKLAWQAGRSPRVPWWRRIPELPHILLERPQLIAAQGLAAVMLALASWQIFGFMSTFQPTVGNVGYAMELVAASPAAVYLGSFQIDFQNLGLWSVVALAGWLLSENGVIGRRIASSGLRLP